MIRARLQQLFSPSTEAGGRLGGLDGLRGLAMQMVIFCHLHLLGIGWWGLSSFFVLSGFLITRILLKDKDNAASTGEFFKRFYIRRFLRVFPIYYVYLLLLTIAAFTVSSLEKLQAYLLPAWLYIYNFFLAGADHQHTRMLDHLWSLSVEEQFYLVWPFLLLLASRRTMPYVAMGLILAGPLLRAGAAAVWPPDTSFQFMQEVPLPVYVLTTSHLDAFAFGALINFINYKPRGWHLWLTLAVAFVLGGLVNGISVIPEQWGATSLVLGWPLFLPDGHQYVWGYSIVDFFWFQIICAIVHGGAIKRFFTINILDWMGKRSYSTYIFHFPLLALTVPLWNRSMNLLGDQLGTLAFSVAFVPLALGVAALSYRFIEMPMLKFKDHFATDATRPPAAAALRPDQPA